MFGERNVILDVFAAYGHTYKDESAAKAAWSTGQHDWKLYKGPYLSVRDVWRSCMMKYSHVRLHWQDKSGSNHDTIVALPAQVLQ